MLVRRGKILTALAGSIAAIGLCMSTMASQQITVNNLYAWGNDGGAGGPFEVTPSGFSGTIHGLGKWGAASNRFITFCVETDEFLSTSTYDVVINTVAVRGGSGGPDPDPLDDRTAFLYTAFIEGTLDDMMDSAFAMTGKWKYGDEPYGNALQEAIWKIEEEVGKPFNALAQDIKKLADDAVSGGGTYGFSWTKGLGKVRVLNMNRGTTFHQDILIMIPLPASLALGLIGLLGVVAYRRFHHF